MDLLRFLWNTPRQAAKRQNPRAFLPHQQGWVVLILFVALGLRLWGLVGVTPCPFLPQEVQTLGMLGLSEMPLWVLRLSLVVCSVLAVALLFVWGRTIHSTRLGLYAAALMGFSGFQVLAVRHVSLPPIVELPLGDGAYGLWELLGALHHVWLPTWGWAPFFVLVLAVFVSGLNFVLRHRSTKPSPTMVLSVAWITLLTLVWLLFGGDIHSSTLWLLLSPAVYTLLALLLFLASVRERALYLAILTTVLGVTLLNGVWFTFKGSERVAQWQSAQAHLQHNVRSDSDQVWVNPSVHTATAVKAFLPDTVAVDTIAVTSVQTQDDADAIVNHVSDLPTGVRGIWVWLDNSNPSVHDIVDMALREINWERTESKAFGQLYLWYYQPIL